MFWSGRKALPDDREWSVGPLRCPGVVGRPSWVSGSGRLALPDVWEWSGGPHGCPGVVGRPSRMSGRSRETLPNVWSAFPNVREWLEGPL